jgi:hypothetical protein
MVFPKLTIAQQLPTDSRRRALICAYGFEERSLGWCNIQAEGKLLTEAYVIRYEPNKSENKIQELRENLIKLGVDYPREIVFDLNHPEKLERLLEKHFKELDKYDEVIIDVTAMTKFLILVSLFKLTKYKRQFRLVYSEASDYAPSESQYHQYKRDSSVVAHFPSQGFRDILRAKCLSSIRMQGQPVALVAFTSFNEQLVRHILGTINPFRLVFINGLPPREDYSWRKHATQFIHRRLISEYRMDNAVDESTGLLSRTASTLHYDETIACLNSVYEEFGNYERIIIAATGSKMQTVGLFFAKIIHPEFHIEYPTPDSYFFTGMSTGVKQVHELFLPEFNRYLEKLASGWITNSMNANGYI